MKQPRKLRKKTALKNLYKFSQDKQYTDVIIEIEGQEFHCHQLILAASIPFFSKKFPLHRKQNSILRMSFDSRFITKIGFDALLKIVYTERLILDSSNCLDLFQAAQFFELKQILPFIADKIDEYLNVNNALGFRRCAELEQIPTLRDKCSVCINSSLSEVLRSEEFLNLNFYQVEDFVCEFTGPNNEIEPHEQMFLAILKWIDHLPSKRRNHLCALLKTFSLDCLMQEFIILILNNNPLVQEFRDHLRLPELEAPLSFKGILFAFSRNINTYHWKYYSSICKWVLVSSRKTTQSIFGTFLVREKIYLLGDKKIEMINPINMKYTIVTAMMPDCIDAAAEFYDNNFYIAGGGQENGKNNMTHFYKFNLLEPISTKLAQMSFGRKTFSLIQVSGSLFALGGAIPIEKYNINTNTWTIVGNIPNDFDNIIKAIALNNIIYVLDRKGQFGMFDMEYKWSDLPSLNDKKYYDFSLTIKDNKIHAFFYDGNNESWSYDQDNKCWNSFSMPNCPISNCHTLFYPFT